MVCKWYWDLRETRLGSFARETTELRVARAAHNYTVMHGATCGQKDIRDRDKEITKHRKTSVRDKKITKH